MPPPATLLRAVGAGVLLTLALPPFGWWPLAILGIAVLAVLLDDPRTGRRTLVGAATGVGFLAPGLWWMHEFSLPGYVIAVAVEVALFSLVGLLASPGSGRWLAVPGAVVVAETVRGVFPFGGVPIAMVAQTHVDGPLTATARLGGTLLLAAVVAGAGLAVAAASQRAWRVAALAAVAVVVVGLAAVAAPHGSDDGSLRVALVQGGGQRGTRAINSSSAAVFERHVDAHGDVRTPVDLVLWPEDVIDVDGDVTATREGATLSRLADATGATLVAGAVEGDGDRFRNAAVAWGPDGEPVDRYEKVQRVPYGEYVPFRSVIERVADVSAIPRDAVAGRGPGILTTPAGRFGVLVSYEVFFSRRADSAVDAGATLLLVPTNASSFSTTQMPALQIGSARLRAVETGRTVLQAGPTGFTAVIDADGDVVQRSDLGVRVVLHTEAQLRRGRTPYNVVGDAPTVIGAVALVASGWLVHRRRTAGPGEAVAADEVRSPAGA